MVGRAGWGWSQLSGFCASTCAEKRGQVPEVPSHSTPGRTQGPRTIACVCPRVGEPPPQAPCRLPAPTAGPPSTKPTSVPVTSGPAARLQELMGPNVVQRIQAPPFPLLQGKSHEGQLQAASSLLAGDTKRRPRKPRSDSTHTLPAWTGEVCPGSELSDPTEGSGGKMGPTSPRDVCRRHPCSHSGGC